MGLACMHQYAFTHIRRAARLFVLASLPAGCNGRAPELLVVTGTPFSGLTPFSKLLLASEWGEDRHARADVWLERVVPFGVCSDCGLFHLSSLECEVAAGGVAIPSDREERLASVRDYGLNASSSLDWSWSGAEAWRAGLLARAGASPALAVEVFEGLLDYGRELLALPSVRLVIWRRDVAGILDSLERRSFPARDPSRQCARRLEAMRARAEELAVEFPERVRLLDALGEDSPLNVEEEFYALLDWLGLPGSYRFGHVDDATSVETLKSMKRKFHPDWAFASSRGVLFVDAEDCPAVAEAGRREAYVLLESGVRYGDTTQGHGNIDAGEAVSLRGLQHRLLNTLHSLRASDPRRDVVLLSDAPEISDELLVFVAALHAAYGGVYLRSARPWIREADLGPRLRRVLRWQPHHMGWKNYVKLMAWLLEDYDAVLVLESDVTVLRPLDNLFRCLGPGRLQFISALDASAPMTGGSFGLVPGRATFEAMRAALAADVYSHATGWNRSGQFMPYMSGNFRGFSVEDVQGFLFWFFHVAKGGPLAPEPLLSAQADACRFVYTEVGRRLPELRHYAEVGMLDPRVFGGCLEPGWEASLQVVHHCFDNEELQRLMRSALRRPLPARARALPAAGPGLAAELERFAREGLPYEVLCRASNVCLYLGFGDVCACEGPA